MASAEPLYANDLLLQEVGRSFSSAKLWLSPSSLRSNLEFCTNNWQKTLTMKLKFWKRSKKSKTAKASKDDKCQRKSEDCAECESLRTIVEGKFIGIKHSWIYNHFVWLCADHQNIKCPIHLFQPVQIWQILHVILESTSQFSFKFSINLQCHQT